MNQQVLKVEEREAVDMFGGEEQWTCFEKRSSENVWRRGAVDMFGG